MGVVGRGHNRIRDVCPTPAPPLQVSSILNASKVWDTFREQKHDLFIKNTQVAGYLTGPTTGVAGYLTAGPSASLGNAPPPTEPPDEEHTRDDVEVP